MEKTPRVSLIIPVYNKAPFLERCFDSIENYEGLEVIVIDDGSDDGSFDICKKYCDEKGWHLFRVGHKGVSYARNFGMERAKGCYIAFLDADDCLVEGASEHFVKMANNEMSHNIIQFGHYVCKNYPIKILRTSMRGWHSLEDLPKNTWVLVWDKLYRREFIENLGLIFRADLTFGEDELFNVEALIANRGCWVVSRALGEHYLDDMDSICRGGLCLDWINTLHKELTQRMEKTKDNTVKRWLETVIRVHEESKTFRQFGFCRKIKECKGKYDVVYLLKDTKENPELVHSVRSVVENFPHHKIVFCGGKPDNLEPDLYIKVEQDMPSKWENTRKNLQAIVDDDRITENFWLFNDDFFALEPISEEIIAYYDNYIDDVISKTERAFGHPIAWTTRLRHLLINLKDNSLPERNYAVHKPMLMSRKKLKKLLGLFPDEPMIRALYGNYYHVRGKNSPDYKVRVKSYDLGRLKNWDFVSTQDDSFEQGNIGRYLRDKFCVPSRLEQK